MHLIKTMKSVIRLGLLGGYETLQKTKNNETTIDYQSSQRWKYNEGKYIYFRVYQALLKSVIFLPTDILIETRIVTTAQPACKLFAVN